MKKKQPRTRRPRPGETYEVWRIHYACTPDRPFGHLVTNSAIPPRPIALVRGSLKRSFRIAMEILADKAKAARANDLRRATREDVRKEIGGKLLLPVDSRGRVIKTDPDCAGVLFRDEVFKQDGKTLRQFVCINFFVGSLPDKPNAYKATSPMGVIESDTWAPPTFGPLICDGGWHPSPPGLNEFYAAHEKQLELERKNTKGGSEAAGINRRQRKSDEQVGRPIIPTPGSNGNDGYSAMPAP